MPLDIGTDGSYENFIKKAVDALRAKDYIAAQEYIKSAMLENVHAPEVHNLLGTLAELTGDVSLAGKHYRAAYALEPSYKPPSRNLGRITSFFYSLDNTAFDFGDKPEEKEIIHYTIEFDKKNVGHVIKRSR